MLIALLLITLGIGWRLAISLHAFEALGMGTPYNLVPIGAIALYAGARLPLRWAFMIPLAVLVLSDVVIDMGHGYPYSPATRLTTYAFYTAIVGLGLFARRGSNPLRIPALSVAASTLFFLVSNFVVWVQHGGFGFPMTFDGLMSTYAVALPFYQNTLIGDLIGVGILFFGLDAILSRLPDSVAAWKPGRVSE